MQFLWFGANTMLRNQKNPNSYVEQAFLKTFYRQSVLSGIFTIDSQVKEGLHLLSEQVTAQVSPYSLPEHAPSMVLKRNCF